MKLADKLREDSRLARDSTRSKLAPIVKEFFESIKFQAETVASRGDTTLTTMVQLDLSDLTRLKISIDSAASETVRSGVRDLLEAEGFAVTLLGSNMVSVSWGSNDGI